MSSFLLRIIVKKVRIYYASILIIPLLFLGCATTKSSKEQPNSFRSDAHTAPAQTSAGNSQTPGNRYGIDDHGYISLQPELKAPALVNSEDSLAQLTAATVPSKVILETVFPNSSPVANTMVETYLKSENKEPEGHCLSVSKRRFERAYLKVHGHSPYQDLPDSMASKFNTPKQVFDLLYISASEKHRRWRSLPEIYRGKGNAGAIAYAGMGTLVGTSEIWSGELRPGALMQVWRFKDDYEEVVRGTNVKKLDPYGHSFIFIRYLRDEKNAIVGLQIADQGFQSYRPLIPSDYEVWWGVNLSV
jgi:hypothetical protein